MCECGCGCDHYKESRSFPPKVVPVAPTCCDLFKTTVIPASLGGSTGDYKPANGAYRNMIVSYEADGAVYIYDSVGVFTNVKEAN